MSKMLRKKFCLDRLSPVSIDLIEPNLYLGSRSAAEDIDTLKTFKITHILTIEDIPVSDKISNSKNFTVKFISLSDLPREDLLMHLDDTYAFISQGLSEGSVLVHCFYGVSRSASTVIAFVMRKHQLSYEEAFEKVRRRRTRICPNTGFVSQLRLYKEMGYKINPSHANYKTYRLQVVTNQVRKTHTVPRDCMDIIQDDPGFVPLQPESKVYCCKKCSRILADESHLIPHKHYGDICEKSYFVMPIAWMDVTKTIQKPLHCPKCSSEIGSSNWISGIRCPCEFKQTPAFYLAPSEVDFIKPSKL